MREERGNQRRERKGRRESDFILERGGKGEGGETSITSLAKS